MNVAGIVLPTIAGREDTLARATRSHFSHPWPFATVVLLHVERDHATCGEAWNAGAAFLLEHFGLEDEDVLLFSADDLEPRPGYLDAALGCLRRGELPAPRLLTPAGERDPRTDDGPANATVAFSRIPCFTVETYRRLGPCPPLHYYSDAYYGDRAANLGLTTRVVEGFDFVHHWSEVGRYGDERHAIDRRIYEQAGREHHVRIAT